MRTAGEFQQLDRQLDGQAIQAVKMWLAELLVQSKNGQITIWH